MSQPVSTYCWCRTLRDAGASGDVKCGPCLVRENAALRRRIETADPQAAASPVSEARFQDDEYAACRVCGDPRPDHTPSECQPYVQALKQQLEHFWTAVARGWDIEPRSYFEREAVPMGFKSPVEMAVHHMWKRHAKEWPNADLAASSSSRTPNPHQEAWDLVQRWRVNGDRSIPLKYAANELEAALETPTPEEKKEL